MSLKIVKFKAEHGLELIKGGTRVSKLVFGADAEQWAKIKEERGPAATATDNGKIIGCGGLELLRDGLAEAWCVLCEDVAKWCRLPVLIREQIKLWIDEYDLFRVQAIIKTDFPAGVRFAKWLGFQYEGFHQLYMPGGENAWMYVILNERNVRKWK